MTRERKNGPFECKGGLQSVVDDAYSVVQGVRDEVQEVVEGASGTPRESTQRIQTMQETVDNLNNCDDPPEIPEAVADVEVTYVEMRGRKYQSRSWQVSNACNMLTAAKERLEEKVQELVEKQERLPKGGKLSDEEEQLKTDCEAAIDELDNHINEFESAEFPGMFG